MSKLAFLFPGQASQYPCMGKDLAANFAESRAVFEEADAALGFPISQLCFEGSEDALKLTENTQPAILTVSVAAYRALAARGIEPDFAAGHSLGEYSALVAAGALEFSEAVKLVRQRGRYMQEAVPAGEGAMAAILGLSPADVAEVCKKAAGGDVVSPANLNSPEQTVIAGDATAVKRAVEIASQAGAKRAVILAVSAPFHCSLLAPAQKRLEADLRADEKEVAERGEVQHAAFSDHHQRGRRGDYFGRRGARIAAPPGDDAGPLAGVGARDDRAGRQHFRRSRTRQGPLRAVAAD